MQSELTNKEVHPTGTATAAARSALATALILGFAAERLLWNGPTGIGWVLWIALLGAGGVLTVWRARLPWLRDTALSAGLAVGAATIFALRASETLHLLALLVLITAASLPLLRARSFRFGVTPVAAQILGLVLVPLHAALGIIPLTLRDAGRNLLPARIVETRLAVAARGALLAVPPLIVFAALFASADPLFEHYARELLRFGTQDLMEHLILALAFAWIAGGLLRGLLPSRLPLQALPPVPTIGSTEVTIAIGAVTALFTAFVAVQTRWLFGGVEALQAVTGLTVAEYARRGFFELVAAAALTLPLLLAADAVARPSTPAARRLLRLLSVSLIVLVLVVMASALERMSLYTERFGLTELRLYTTAFMAWLGVVFGWFLITTLRGRRRRFAAGPVAAGIAATFALAALNPDALIARVNVERARGGATLDAMYLAGLSADATPVLLRNIDTLPDSSRCHVARRLVSFYERSPVDWRSANLSLLRAQSAIEPHLAALRGGLQTCPRTHGQTRPAS